MLRFVLGMDWVSNREEILSYIASDVHNKQGGRILMVPELISYDTERRLCACAGDSASKFAEVLSFSRLTQRVCDYLSLPMDDCLDAGGRVVAMASAVRQLRASLKAYAALETKPEFLAGLIDAVDEFKRCCITSDDLKSAARQADGSFAQKLEELALLLEGYNSLTSLGKRDPRDQMSRLLELLEECDFGENHVFYIDGFPDFTRQHMAILEHLIVVSPLVVISLNCDRIGSEALAYEKAGQTAKDLMDFAKRQGIETEIRNVSAPADTLSQVRENLLQGKIQRQDHSPVEAQRATSVFAEVIASAQKILSLVQNGARFRDISVVCADVGIYKPVLHTVFSRFKIPYYLSGTESILERPVIYTALAALEAALGGFDTGDILRYLRSALSPLNLSDCDRLENYVILWNIQGSGWLSKWENHPEGLAKDWTDRAHSELAKLNSLREQVILPLLCLRDGFRDAKTLASQVRALYLFLEEISLAERLDKLSAAFDSEGDYRDGQILSQLWDILIGALEQLYDVLGNTAWDSDTFVRLFRLLLSQYDVGTIPPVLDAVTTGPVSAMRCQEEKHLIVLGMLEGSMPSYSGSAGVLNDKERMALREMGIPLTGGAMDGLKAEFAEIYGVFCGARESITAYCPAGQPSFVFRRLAAICGGESEADPSVGFAMADSIEAAAYLAQFSDRLETEELALADDQKRILDAQSYAYGNVSRESIQKLYGDTLLLSASQVDKQADCRLAYFLQYGLRVKERKTITVDPAEFGTYVHEVLEHTVSDVMQQGGFSSVSDNDVLAIAHRYSDLYIQTHFAALDSQRLAYLFKRNQDELQMVVRELCSELRASRFAPHDFELFFGSGGKMPPIDVSGRQMQALLRGYVDRVDTWQENGKNYFRVVDYKTGRKDFDYCDVFNGVGLQMLLYLFALQQGGEALLGENPIPAGVQYFPARAPLVASDNLLTEEEATNARRKEWKRKGLLLCEEAVLSAMDSENNSGRLDYSVKKDGTITGGVATAEQLQLLKRYVISLLEGMVDEIASGDVTPNPYSRGSYHNACAYCPYGQVCHPETLETRRVFQAMNATRFWEEVEKEVCGNGR